MEVLLRSQLFFFNWWRIRHGLWSGTLLSYSQYPPMGNKADRAPLSSGYAVMVTWAVTWDKD